MNITNINHIERRGTLHYFVGDDLKTLTGHFMLSLDSSSVVARNLRGRNRWQLCRVESVAFFSEEVAK